MALRVRLPALFTDAFNADDDRAHWRGASRNRATRPRSPRSSPAMPVWSSASAGGPCATHTSPRTRFRLCFSCSRRTRLVPSERTQLAVGSSASRAESGWPRGGGKSDTQGDRRSRIESDETANNPTSMICSGCWMKNWPPCRMSSARRSSRVSSRSARSTRPRSSSDGASARCGAGSTVRRNCSARDSCAAARLWPAVCSRVSLPRKRMPLFPHNCWKRRFRMHASSPLASALAGEIGRGSMALKAGLAAATVALGLGGLAMGIDQEKTESEPQAVAIPNRPDVAPAPREAAEAEWAAVKGRIVFPDKRDIPAARVVPANTIKDFEFFGLQTHRDVLIDPKSRGIANVVVWLRRTRMRRAPRFRRRRFPRS